MGEPQQQQQQQQPTFSWTGAGRHEGSRIYYSSFNFAGEPYALGDCVYLLPEEEGAPPYIAKLMRAWEDTAAADAEKLIIEVRWYERRSAVPAVLAAAMHEREVVASDLLDTNLVGCLDKRATVVRASSYEEAAELMAAVVPQAGRSGEWHFCRGVLDSASQGFRAFQELGIGPLDDEFGAKSDSDLLLGDMSAAQLISQGFAGSTAYCNGINAQQQQQQYEDIEMPDAVEADVMVSSKGPGSSSEAKGSCGGNSNRSRRAGAAARVAAATAAACAGAAGGSGVRGIPGKVCCECGATQTPQWREGPQGPKTLCNACGVRYQRSQSKAKSNKRQASERARGERGSPMHARAPKQACLTNRAAAAAGDASKAADGSTPGHGHGTRSASKGGGRHPSQQHASNRSRSGAGSVGAQPGSSAGRNVHQRQQMVQHGGALGAAAAGAAGHGMYELHFYEDEGSPPGMHTHILEEEEEEEQQQQALLRDTLNRSATHEAADVLQTLSLPQQQRLPHLHRPHHHQQQQQQHTMPMSAGYCSMGIGSPSSSMLLVDQLQPDSMPLLSLNDSSLTGVGLNPDGVLMGGPDSLDPSLNPSFPNPGLQQHSLSPLPRSHRLSSAAAGGGRIGATGTSGASAVCASPGRLIAAMVQGLKLPTPLSLNGPASGLPGHSAAAAAAAVSDAPAAAAPIGLDLSIHPQQQQQQQALSMVSSSMLSGQNRSQQLSIGLQHQPLPLHGMPGKGLMLPLPLIGSNSNISAQMHVASGAAAAAGSAAAGGGGVRGGDSTPASAAVSSCEPSDTPGAAAAAAGPAGVSSSMVPNTAAAAGGNGTNSSSCPLLAQLRSLVFRASAFTPDVQGLSGLFPGPSSPRAMQLLVHQLDQLPETARSQLQQVSATVEEQLSKAKAADAAVLAVAQVLAAKKHAAAEARQEVENAVVLLRSLLGQVSPTAAAAAVGTGCCSGEARCSGNHKHTAGCSPGACTTAGGAGCCAAVSSGVTACTAVAVAAGDSNCCVVGSSRLGGNSPRVLVSQGLSHHPTQGFDLSTGVAARPCSSPYSGPGVDGIQCFAGDASDADDLIRDPEEQQQQQQGAGKGPVAPAAAAAGQSGQQLPVAADVKPESDGQQQQQVVVTAGNVPVKQEQGRVEQQQVKQGAMQGDGVLSDASEPSAATATTAAAHAAAEPACVTV